MDDHQLDRRQFIAMGTAGALSLRSLTPLKERSLETPYKLGRLVLAGSGQKGTFDEVAVDCPFVFQHENRWRMVFIGFDGQGYQTGMAVSDDLVNWTKSGVILPRDPSSPVLRHNAALSWILRENDIRSEGRLRKVNGKYLGVYHAYPSAGYEQGAAVIGLGWSEDLAHWMVDPPILTSAEGADWERGGLYKPCLVEHRGTYYLFYNAKNVTEGSWREQTGVATSRDQKHWERYAGNPVIRNGGPGSMDEIFCSDPCVVQNGREWAFFYFGLDAKGVARDLLATGPDLLHPSKHGSAVVDVGPPGSVDSVYAHKTSVVSHQGDLYHFYCAVSRGSDGREVRGISVARSRSW